MKVVPIISCVNKAKAQAGWVSLINCIPDPRQEEVEEQE